MTGEVLFDTEQVSDLRTAFSKPIPTDNSYSCSWQTKDAFYFVKENFGISYFRVQTETRA